MKKLISFTTLSGLFLLSAPSALADAPNITGTININIPNVPTNMGVILSAIVQLIFIIASLATFIFLIWGGIEWITSGGDKTAVESAQKKIQAALLGLFIVFLSAAIMFLVQTFVNVCLGFGCTIIIPHW